MMHINMAFSKKTTPPTPLHSTELFKIFFSLLTLSTAFLQKACGPGKNRYIKYIHYIYIYIYIYIYTTLQYISVCTTAKVSKMICNAIGL